MLNYTLGWKGLRMKMEMDKIQQKITILKEVFKNPQAVISLHKWLETELAYTSNHIEGNRLTRQETALVIQEGITRGEKPFKDYLEAKNHAAAFHYILDVLSKNKNISQNDILTLHALILKGINDSFAGRYRNVPVRIGGSRVILPNPMKVSGLMADFIAYLDQEKDPVQKAIMGHFKFVSIHPFVDGNGRVGRLLMNLILLQNGLWPIIIRPRDRKTYINGIEKGQLTQDTSAYQAFMYKALERSLDSYIDMFQPKTEATHLLKVSEFAKAAGVPVSTVRYWLRAKKLVPIAKTAGDYMLFSREQVEEIQKKNAVKSFSINKR